MTAQRTISINLESLLDLSTKLNSTTDEVFIINSTVLSLMGKLRFFRAMAIVADFPNKKFNVATSKSKVEFKDLPYFEVKEIRSLSSGNQSESLLIESGFQLLVPLVFQNDTLAVICLGKPADSQSLTTEEVRYANLVAMIAATAYQNARNNKHLETAKTNVERRNQLLTTLFEMGRDFSVLQSSGQILRMLSFRLMGQLMVSRFAIFLIDDDKKNQQIINRFDSDLPHQIIDELIETQATAYLESIDLSPETLRSIDSIGAKIISPMYVQGRSRGIMLIGKRMNSKDFSTENLMFIEALGNTAISAIENERLFQEELEKKRLEREMELALEIQKNLLPKNIPDLSNCDVSGTSVPARLVGGDYFDVIILDEKRTLIVIADVSGKGMPAALLMANVQAALRVLASLAVDMKQVVLNINSVVYRNTSADKFVTFFCGIYDSSTGEFIYINAGHNPPLVYRSTGTFEMLTEGGIILGILDHDFDYDQGSVVLNTNDLIVFYTDGVTEALNHNNVEYGEDRLRHAIAGNNQLGSGEIIKAIVDSVAQHTAGSAQFDDITLVVLKKG